MALALTDIPVSVVSLNEQFLADRAAVDAMEVLTFVSGVQRTADANPGQEAFALRGYQLGQIGYRDGLPDPVAAADGAYDDSSAYERLEIIKGPAGTLYGSTSMGGVVNKISKWPSYQRVTKLELQAQSEDQFVRAMVDSTGPLTPQTAYRAVLSVRRGDRYYNEGDAPNDFRNALFALTHKLGGADARLGRVWGRFQHLTMELDRENGNHFPTGFLDGRNPTQPGLLSNPRFAIPVEANTFPDDDISKAVVRAYELGYEKTTRHASLGEWTARLVARHSDARGDKNPSYAQPRAIPVDSAGRIVTYVNAAGANVNGDARFVGADDPRVADWRATMTLREFAGYNERSGAFLDLVGVFDTGPLKHTLILNGQLTEGENERAFFFWNVPNPANTTAVANSFSLVRQEFSAFNAPALRATTPLFNSFSGHGESDGYALGFQNNIAMFGGRLIAVVGARYDHVDTLTYGFNSPQSIAQRRFVPDSATRRTNSNEDSTYKYGLVGKPWQGVSVFAQLGTTYNPISSVNPVTGRINPNQEGEIREVGVKVDLFENRLTATLSLFEMELTNVLVAVPNPPELGGGTVSIPVGKQATDGWELDVTYQPFAGLSLSAAYSDLTSKDELGRWFRGVPRDPSYSLLGKYDFRNGPAKGFYVGASWKHNGSSAGEATNSFFLDESDLVDAFVGYGRGRWGVQLNVANLLDTDDPITAVGDTQVFRALPRNYRVTFRYRF